MWIDWWNPNPKSSIVDPGWVTPADVLTCAIRHFCGAPCPAEAHALNGTTAERGAFCEFYEEQVRYAVRLIADGREDAFLWDGWDNGTDTVFDVKSA